MARPGDRVARILLDASYLLAAPAVLAALLVPSRCFTRRRYRAGLAQKLGAVPPRAGDRPCLWLHAVSVGELRTAVPLVDALRRALPGWDLRVSTSTDTGQDLARSSLPAGVEAFYFPLDLGWSVRRAIRRIRPSAVVLLELEVWPNFLVAAREAGVPVVVGNGRLSPRSFPRYRLLGAAARWLFRGLSAVAAQNEEYAARFEALGIPRDRIAVLGNIKYDGIPRDPGNPEETRATLGWGRDPVLVAGCTHPGEEEALLETWRGLRESRPGLRLVLAPRHVERAREVTALAAARGLPTSWSDPRPGADVLVVDAIGQLDRLYAIADIAFVGGSLIPRGGHNLLEPARLGKPVLFGPSCSNFEDMAGHLLRSRAAIQVPDAPSLGREIEALLADPPGRDALGARAREAAAALRGATGRHVEWLLKILPPVPAKR